MDASSVITATVRRLSVLLMTGILILQIGCSMVQTTVPVTARADRETTTSIEGTVSPVVAELVQSPIQTPSSVTVQVDQDITGFVEATAPMITITVEAAITPQEVEMPSRNNPKLDSSLNQLLEAYDRGGLAEAKAFAKMHQIRLDDDRVQVEVIVNEEAATLSLKEAVEAVGGEYQGHYQTLLQALIPISALASLAQRPEVLAIRQPRQPVIQ